MAVLNIQADRTAGIFRVYVDGKETVPDEIRITARADQDVEVLIDDKEFLVSEMYINAKRKKARAKKEG